MRLSVPLVAGCLRKSVFSRAGGPTARDNQLSCAVVLYRPHGTKKKGKIARAPPPRCSPPRPAAAASPAESPSSSFASPSSSTTVISLAEEPQATGAPGHRRARPPPRPGCQRGQAARPAAAVTPGRRLAQPPPWHDHRALAPVSLQETRRRVTPCHSHLVAIFLANSYRILVILAVYTTSTLYCERPP